MPVERGDGFGSLPETPEKCLSAVFPSTCRVIGGIVGAIMLYSITNTIESVVLHGGYSAEFMHTSVLLAER
jgi:hypothetical protein